MAKFIGVHNETGEQREMTEGEVRTEITHMFQHDMGKQQNDEEIAQAVADNEIEDYFDNGSFEGNHYKITIQN